MNNKHYTIQDLNIIKTYYPLNQLDYIVNHIGRSIHSVKNKAHRLGIKVNVRRITKRHHKQHFKYTNQIIAQTIEFYVSNPDLTQEQIAKANGITEHHLACILSRFFAYKGSDPLTVVLCSNI